MIREQRVVTVTEATFVRRYGTLSLPSLLVFVDGVERPGSSAPCPSAGSSPSWRSSCPRRDARARSEDGWAPKRKWMAGNSAGPATNVAMDLITRAAFTGNLGRRFALCGER